VQDLLKPLLPPRPVGFGALVAGQPRAARVSLIEACSTEIDLENDTVTSV